VARDGKPSGFVLENGSLVKLAPDEKADEKAGDVIMGNVLAKAKENVSEPGNADSQKVREIITLNVEDEKSKDVGQVVLISGETDGGTKAPTIWWIGWLVVILALAAIAYAWYQSGHETKEMKHMDEEFERLAAAATAASGQPQGGGGH